MASSNNNSAIAPLQQPPANSPPRAGEAEATAAVEEQSAFVFVDELKLAGGLSAAAALATAGGFFWGTRQKKEQKQSTVQSTLPRGREGAPATAAGRSQPQAISQQVSLHELPKGRPTRAAALQNLTRGRPVIQPQLSVTSAAVAAAPSLNELPKGRPAKMQAKSSTAAPVAQPANVATKQLLARPGKAKLSAPSGLIAARALGYGTLLCFFGCTSFVGFASWALNVDSLQEFSDLMKAGVPRTVKTTREVVDPPLHFLRDGIASLFLSLRPYVLKPEEQQNLDNEAYRRNAESEYTELQAHGIPKSVLGAMYQDSSATKSLGTTENVDTSSDSSATASSKTS